MKPRGVYPPPRQYATEYANSSSKMFFQDCTDRRVTADERFYDGYVVRSKCLKNNREHHKMRLTNMLNIRFAQSAR